MGWSLKYRLFIENRYHTRVIPQLGNKRIHSSKGWRWWALEDGVTGQCSLLDPATMREIQLPSLKTMPSLMEFCILSSPPDAADSECSLVLIYSYRRSSGGREEEIDVGEGEKGQEEVDKGGGQEVDEGEGEEEVDEGGEGEGELEGGEEDVMKEKEKEKKKLTKKEKTMGNSLPLPYVVKLGTDKFVELNFMPLKSVTSCGRDIYALMLNYRGLIRQCKWLPYYRSKAVQLSYCESPSAG